MNKILPKFYYLKDMTQEDLNELVLERNILASKDNVLQQKIDNALEIIDYRLKENDKHINARMEMFHYKNLKEILKGDSNEDKK